MSTLHQNFARTERPLTDGMCGGPVLVRKTLSNVRGTAAATAAGAGESYAGTTPRDFICGMVEGIVPLHHPDPSLRGLASYIDSAEITK